MHFFKSKLFILNILILVVIGLMMVYSSSNVWALYKYNDSFYYLKRQLLFACVGIVAMLFVAKIDYHIYKEKAKLILLISFTSLVLVLIPGLGIARGGARSWFGFAGFSIQPSEFFKIAMIIYTAKYIEKNYISLKRFRGVLPVFLNLMLAFGLIMLQPDFGSGIVLICAIVVMILATPLPFKYFIRLGMVGVAGIIGLIASAPYRLARITSYLDPFSDPLGAGFQMIQALYAIGPGGIMGVGYNNSFQKHFYLPEPQTDFIFAIFAEEFGLIGCVVLIILMAWLLKNGFDTAMHAKDLFGCYLSIGIIAVICIQIMINLGVIVGLLPVTGITLPFISYGGSSLTLLLISMGILINIRENS